MKRTIPLLIVGILIGLEAAHLVSGRLNSSRADLASPPPSVARMPVAKKAAKYPSREMALERLRHLFSEAVVVVVADESYDDNLKVVHETAREVWKGPKSLVGKCLDDTLEPPLSYQHSSTTERVLLFLPLTPHIDTREAVFFSGDALRINPAITLDSLRVELGVKALAPNQT